MTVIRLGAFLRLPLVGICFEAIPFWLSKYNASPFSAEQELGVLYLCLLFQELRQRKENWLEPNEDAAREAAMKVTIILLVDYY